MYNKIAPIILNSGKTVGLSDVFVSQPDALKENLAGKIFVLAEIGGKKNDVRKIWNFLISALNDNYYNDEKILLRDKIEGLKIENIFEAALAKTNKALGDFLLAEKIKINPAVTNITLGVVYENKLHFSGIGKNRALLLYRRAAECEIINVEANAADSPEAKTSAEAITAKTPSLFSSVISGEIPTGSYFVFSSESLPEYLSGKELVNIITKLPPIVAAEQIKNVLDKMNTYVPFLGIIIKNTAGALGQEVREEAEENLTAQSSISSLNYTEQKTERMLAPAGLISFSKTFKKISQALKNLKSEPSATIKKVYKPEEEKITPVSLDLGKINSLKMARADSFLVKEKIFFKCRSNWFWAGFKKTILTIPRLFNPVFWKSLIRGFKNWLKTLNQKNRLLFVILAVVVIVFAVSLMITKINKNRQEARNNFTNLVAQIEGKQNLIDSHLLYNDEDGARVVLTDAEVLLNSFPQKTNEQKNTYSRLLAKEQEQRDKIQKIIKINAPEKVNDLSGLNVSNLVFAAGKIYAASDKIIYGLTPNSASSTRAEVATVTSLSNPQFDGAGGVYYWSNDSLAKLDVKTGQTRLISIPAELKSLTATSFKIYNNSLYVLVKDKNQIYKSRYDSSKKSYLPPANWFNKSVDLSAATDFYISVNSNSLKSGRVYVLKNDGQVLKFLSGSLEDYRSTALSPVMVNANKIIVGTKYIYIFEAGAKRLVVLAFEDGHLMSQYQVDSLSRPKDFAIDEAGKAAYFLDNEMIYKINLNQ
jgi:hypothetical protein